MFSTKRPRAYMVISTMLTSAEILNKGVKIMAKKTRYDFTWLNHENNHEITDWVIANSEKEAIEKFKAEREAAGKEYPTNCTVKNTFLVV